MCAGGLTGHPAEAQPDRIPYPPTEMNRHRVLDLILESSIPLPGVPRAGEEPPECRFALLPELPLAPPDRWTSERRAPDGSVWLLLGRSGSLHWLRVPGIADFMVTADGREISGAAPAGTPPETIHHLLLDQVIPLVLTLRNRWIFHASAVATGQGAVAFFGETGFGKSTIAASFCTRGHPLITDDCLLVKESAGAFAVQPSYPGLRLRADSSAVLFGPARKTSPVAHYTSKRRLDLAQMDVEYAEAPVPLRAAFLLARSSRGAGDPVVRMTPIPPSTALIELVRHSYRLDIADRTRLADELDLLGRLLRVVPLQRLSYPSDYAALPAVEEAILRQLRSRAEA